MNVYIYSWEPVGQKVVFILGGIRVYNDMLRTYMAPYYFPFAVPSPKYDRPNGKTPIDSR